MDFTNRSVPVQHPEVGHTSTPVTPGINLKHSSTKNNKESDESKWTRIGVFACFFAVVILIVALIVLVAANNNSGKIKAEGSYIKSNKLQAVFLNTGQVYFGNINSLNTSYLVLSNIYYLQSSSGSTAAATTSSSSSNVSLVKLGCELHRPYDQMVINLSQVTFWENLQSDGQVATAVAKYQQENPKHTCVDQSTSAATTTGNAAQAATSGTKQ